MLPTGTERWGEILEWIAFKDWRSEKEGESTVILFAKLNPACEPVCTLYQGQSLLLRPITAHILLI